jgi:hypothetical protein
MTEALLLLRRWFVSACAFVGAGFFGWYLYELSSQNVHIPGAMWGIIGAAVGVASVLALLPTLVTRSDAQSVGEYQPDDEQPEIEEQPESHL